MPEKILNADEAMSQAKSLEKSGKFAQAEQIYHLVLQQHPANKRAKKRLRSVQKARSRQGRPATVSLAPKAGLDGLIGLFNQGRLPEALAQGAALSQRHPADPTIHNILGVINARMGKIDTALACYDQALAIKPSFAEVHNNRGNALNRSGRRTDAIASFRKALAIKPAYAEAHNSLGSALHDAGELEQAVASYRKALQIKPAYAEAHNNLGNVLADMGRTEAALASFNAVLKLNPGFAQAHYNRGNMLRSLGRHDEAISSFEKAVRFKPDYAEAFNSLGNTLNEQGSHQQAVESLSRAIRLNPGYGEAHSNLGNVLSDLRRLDDAVLSYRAAVEISPGFAEGHCNLGNTLSDMGRYEEAIASYEQALALKPDFAEVHNNLSQVKTFERDDPQVARMQKRLADQSVTDNEVMHLGFALGKAYDDLGNVDQAFEQFTQANQLKKQALGYNIIQDQDQFELIKSLFPVRGKPTPDQGAETASGYKKQPIFIVGVPRSGTSLVEQILASHSQVYGAGELEILGRVLNPLLRGLASTEKSSISDEVFKVLRNTYLEEIDRLPASEPFITDKMPVNFKWIGFLLSAMPGVKIINVQRDPVASCWSMFRRHFGGGGNAYAYDLVDVAEYYKLYFDLMEFWRLTFPGQIYDLSYEALTENQEPETRRLLEYCGLDWEERCLEFYTSKRSVQTLSGQQVRKAMYTGSSRVWQRYAAHLQPMLESLGIQNQDSKPSNS